MDLQSHRLFGSCGNGILIVVDAANGKIIAQVPIGQGSDGVRFDPMTRLIFTSNGEGSLSIIHEDSDDSYPAVATVPTERGARTLEIDLTTHRIFTATAKFGPVPEVQNGERRRPPLMPGSFVVLEYAP
jgi:DNA-binding beta-propeller fold protein YncE